ncbi:hypothetical protein SISNIDRAFT_471286 [Sistotremastrum niveocremeum HHB9708]|uniref:Uncharacterized protein n=1 Tax=Sistotremastrum niveocremeum HHB9708 TaxID=1314777 RepID=A0A164MUQ1_9AGAM|nr:hypothetical protein SISNIDRAFT_471286 [Sistotremastrum niveocremeum HHB9708]
MAHENLPAKFKSESTYSAVQTLKWDPTLALIIQPPVHVLPCTQFPIWPRTRVAFQYEKDWPQIMSASRSRDKTSRLADGRRGGTLSPTTSGPSSMQSTFPGDVAGDITYQPLAIVKKKEIATLMDSPRQLSPIADNARIPRNHPIADSFDWVQRDQLELLKLHFTTMSDNRAALGVFPSTGGLEWYTAVGTFSICFGPPQCSHFSTRDTKLTGLFPGIGESRREKRSSHDENPNLSSPQPSHRAVLLHDLIFPERIPPTELQRTLKPGTSYTVWRESGSPAIASAVAAGFIEPIVQPASCSIGDVYELRPWGYPASLWVMSENPVRHANVGVWSKVELGSHCPLDNEYRLHMLYDGSATGPIWSRPHLMENVVFERSSAV